MKQTPQVGRMTATQALHDREVAFLGNLGAWPRWPFLPLINRKTQREGFLYADYASAQDGYRVYHANLFGMRELSAEQRAAVTYTNYETAEQLLAEYRID